MTSSCLLRSCYSKSHHAKIFNQHQWLWSYSSPPVTIWLTAIQRLVSHLKDQQRLFSLTKAITWIQTSLYHLIFNLCTKYHILLFCVYSWSLRFQIILVSKSLHPMNTRFGSPRSGESSKQANAYIFPMLLHHLNSLHLRLCSGSTLMAWNKYYIISVKKHQNNTILYLSFFW